MKPNAASNAFRGLLWPLVGLGALLLFNLCFVDNFFTLKFADGRLTGTLVDILNRGSEVAILAIGMTLVIATGGVDLSVGSLMAIAGAICAMLITVAHWSFGAALGVSLAATTLMGGLNGLLIARLSLQPIVATLVFMVAGRGIAMLLTGGQVITFETPAFVYLANGSFLGLPFAITLTALVYLVAWAVTRRTAIGWFVEAVGDGERASRLCGVPARLIKTLVYAASGLCAGLAGLLATSNIKAADVALIGETKELDAIFAVIVGGTALTGGRFTLAGSLIGALLIRTLTVTMYGMGVPPAVAPVPKALVILAVCLAQSEQFRARFAAVFRRRAAA